MSQFSFMSTYQKFTTCLAVNCSISIICFLTVGCGPNEAILKSNSSESTNSNATANSQPAYDSVESEIENMRTADFDSILVLRRKDDSVMRSDDKAFVRNMITNA